MGARKLTYLDHDRLVMSLIQDDIVNSRLLNTLSNIGLDATSSYGLHIHETVLWLIGFDREQITDGLLDHYFLLLEQAHKLELKEMKEKLELLANSIYLELAGSLKTVSH